MHKSPQTVSHFCVKNKQKNLQQNQAFFGKKTQKTSRRSWRDCFLQLELEKTWDRDAFWQISRVFCHTVYCVWALTTLWDVSSFCALPVILFFIVGYGWMRLRAFQSDNGLRFDGCLTGPDESPRTEESLNNDGAELHLWSLCVEFSVFHMLSTFFLSFFL